ncbi:MAG TPA: porin [Flavobacteriales bacterium]|nr:porin [Flavobacteriales bacterium]HIO73145.1 porin [Flavobacteriales bacterium]
MRNYLVELIGTFFLVLVIGLSGDPIAIGCMLMVMVYMGGHVSGAHYNPAVTLGVLMRGKIGTKDGMMYMLFQLIGALIAAYLYYLIKGEAFAPAPNAEIHILKPIIVEAVFTFALVSVVLNVATHSKTEGNSYYGLAIGFTILAAAFAGGNISGGAYNPAVGTGPILVDMLTSGGSMGNLWIYLVGPFLGGAVAALVFKFINPDE